jgi:hypothetical protein
MIDKHFNRTRPSAANPATSSQIVLGSGRRSSPVGDRQSFPHLLYHFVLTYFTRGSKLSLGGLLRSLAAGLNELRQ